VTSKLRNPVRLNRIRLDRFCASRAQDVLRRSI
jgi:hypothetical protein